MNTPLLAGLRQLQRTQFIETGKLSVQESVTRAAFLRLLDELQNEREFYVVLEPSDTKDITAPTVSFKSLGVVVTVSSDRVEDGQ